MTPRPLARMRRAARWMAVLSALGLLAGCDPRSLIYFLQPFEPTIAPPCPPLKGKRVVVITNTVPGTQSDFASLDRDLTRQITTILREKVKKIDVVDPEKVFTWAAGNPSWTESADLAKAFDAEVVIFLEVQHFEIQNPSSPGLYEGRSNIHIRVTEWDHPKDSRDRPMTDKPKEARIIYEGDRDTSFPVTGHIPASADVSRATFKNKFLKLVATEVSWHFVPHAHGDNIQDTKFHGE